MGRYIDYFEIQPRDLIKVEKYSITIIRRGHTIRYDFKKPQEEPDTGVEISIDGIDYEMQYLDPDELKEFRQECLDGKDKEIERIAQDLFSL